MAWLEITINTQALLFAGAYFIRHSFGAALLIAGVWVLSAQTGIVKNGAML